MVNLPKSLEEVHRTIPIHGHFSWWRKLLAFAGPGYLVAVGYMDPGNWATDLAGGSKFGYSLLAVILISNLLAMLLQHLSLKLGIVTGRDLASISHRFPKRLRLFLWIMAEIAITACDLAEVIGSAIALNLLFKIPLFIGVLITSLDVLILLLLQHRGLRYLEALVITLISVIAVSFGIEIFLSQPNLPQLLTGFIPSTQLFTNPQMLYIAIGILGATVMPHNLYLHSALVQSRSFKSSIRGKAEAIFFATIDSTLALSFAFFVNCAILILAAATFYKSGLNQVAEIGQAHQLLTPLLGTSLGSVLFAVALLASGHNSTITGTLAGQVVMEGFVHIKLAPWQRRLLTRLLAIVPAIIVVWFYGSGGLAKLLVFSQVILSLQLPFAVIPLVYFTSDKKLMKRFVNRPWLKIASWSVAALITVLNLFLIQQTFFSL
ncbi:MAG: Nramp family divalent metal transporter [bacterium]|nr:Nramp family divalent metal transporter [bacterium]